MSTTDDQTIDPIAEQDMTTVENSQPLQGSEMSADLLLSEELLEGSRARFYLHALYEFAHDVTRTRDTEQILKRFLRMMTGTFGIPRGVVVRLVCGEESEVELVLQQNLSESQQQTFPEIPTSQPNTDRWPDEHTNRVLSLNENASPAVGTEPMVKWLQSVGMKWVVILYLPGQTLFCVGLGEMLSGEELSAPQRELLNALAQQTEIALGNAIYYQEMVEENRQLKQVLGQENHFAEMLGQSPPMQQLYQQIRRVAAYTNYSVLILGESGTGKELIARAIYQNSPRCDAKFLPINCAALPQELVESELFGHEKGAFTGATSAKPGLFEIADGGTVLLDEIGELPPSTQAKLLRALEQREILRVGGHTVRQVDVRVLAATNRDLTAEIASGRFREDLYFRFDVKLHAPSLSERREDIPLLAQSFLEQVASENDLPVRRLSSDALRSLMQREWSGNVRELRTVLREAVMMSDDTVLQVSDLPVSSSLHQVASQSGLSLPDSLDWLRREMIRTALERSGGNRSQAAQHLGISRQNLQNMLRRLLLS